MFLGKPGSLHGTIRDRHGANVPHMWLAEFHGGQFGPRVANTEDGSRLLDHRWSSMGTTGVDSATG